MLKQIIITFLILGTSLIADNQVWSNHSGSNYRFTESYGQTDIVYKGDEYYVQRLDFTYSHKKQWEIYVTSVYVPTENNSVFFEFIVDGVSYVYSHNTPLNKMGVPVSIDFIEALRNTNSDFVLKEYYGQKTNEKLNHTTVYNAKGLKEALAWVHSINSKKE